MIHLAYALEPIGVDGALEAVRAYGFCSVECRECFIAIHPGTVAAVPEPDSFEIGHVCDECESPLETGQWLTTSPT